MNNQSAYLLAKKRVEGRISFYIHLSVYLLVITLLTILNLTLTKGYFWAMWPIIGWGSAVIIHCLFTFVFTNKSTIKENLIEEEMRKGGLK